MAENLLRHLPQVDKLLQLPALRRAADGAPRRLVTDALRSVLSDLRRDILECRITAQNVDAKLGESEVERRFLQELAQRRLSGYRGVLNGSGIVLHTGLGRAVLSDAVHAAFREELGGYSLVEVDVATGERNRREVHVADLLCELTGAEAATVVNNNAAATLLILAGLARGREVIVSRGQLVEIGGSFRIPDILRESGARLVEVGTTNRTYVDDYRGAVGPNTGLLLQVHTSNYAIRGFTHETSLEELVGLGREVDVPVVSDLGSGCFVDLSPFGFEPEPLVSQRVGTGADLVCFSGDKLLGGPQSGIIVGTKAQVNAVRAHPLFRALRVDKLTLVALEATLQLYREPEKLGETIPALRAIMAPADTVEARARETLGRLQHSTPKFQGEVVESSAQAGSGALPAQTIPSYALALRHPDLPAGEIERRLRLGAPPVFTRIQRDTVLVDFRTLLPGQEEKLLGALASVADGGQ